MFDRDFFIRATAHRGFHDPRAGRIENSATAFEAALTRGYGIECDVRACADGAPVVFHDAVFSRLIDDDRRVGAVPGRDATRLVYRGRQERVMSLDALVDLVGGRVPVLAEIKSDWGEVDPWFIRNIVSCVRRARGRMAVMSFDPAILLALKDVAPDIAIGLVATKSAQTLEVDRCIGAARLACLRQMSLLRKVDPSFVAYDIRYLPDATVGELRMTHGLPVLTWTVRDARQRDIALACADAMIFEGFAPNAESAGISRGANKEIA